MPERCDQLGWVEEDQDFDNACECGLDRGHEGLHECDSGCGGTWAGGLPPVREDANVFEAAHALGVAAARSEQVRDAYQTAIERLVGHKVDWSTGPTIGGQDHG